MKKKIIILGAGIYQVPLIKKAKEMGLETLVVSPKGNYPGISLADIFLDADTTDASRIVLAAKEYAVDGIVTTGTDVSVPSVGAVVDELNLKGPTREMAETVSSKTAFRSFLRRNKLRSPDFAVCECERDAWAFSQRVGGKMVVKPDDSSGSRGVSIVDKCQTEIAVQRAYRHALEFSRNGKVCAEAFIEGREVGGDAFFVNRELQFFTTTCKHMNGVLVQGHSLPGDLSELESRRVKNEICQTAEKIGYTDGPLNFDVMVGDDGATILEMGLRNGGNGIPDLIYHSEGADLMAWLLAYALGEPVPELRSRSSHAVSSYVFGAETAGTLVTLSSLSDLQKSVPEVFDMILARKQGDPVAPFANNANLIGYLLIHCGASAYNQVISRIQKVLCVEVK